jgi:hypothetical protein
MKDNLSNRSETEGYLPIHAEKTHFFNRGSGQTMCSPQFHSILIIPMSKQGPCPTRCLFGNNLYLLTADLLSCLTVSVFLCHLVFISEEDNRARFHFRMDSLRVYLIFTSENQGYSL